MGRGVDIDDGFLGDRTPQELELDAFWQRIRYFLNDQDELGVPIITEAKKLPARKRFLQQCENLCDPRYKNKECRLHIDKLV